VNVPGHDIPQRTVVREIRDNAEPDVG
jgi:hypothetical protein